jgi:sn-glycerol 3-phosphate transport system permease protein
LLVFFFWPAARRCCNRVQQQDAFGTSVRMGGLENFQRLFSDATYLAAFKTTARSRCWWRCWA